jgi:hypothetical protein
MFDPVMYLTTLHKDTDSTSFYQGIANVKSKSAGSSSAALKKDLVMNNYTQFLGTKLTLDDINKKFLSTKEISSFLDELEDSMK